jgi:RND family efflux transporter MFP subunit
MKSEYKGFPLLPSRALSAVRPAPFLIASLPLMLLGSCKKPEVGDPRLLAPRVEVIQLREGNAGTKTYTGIVQARVQSDLGFRVAGKILERAVSEGEKVRRGDVLLRLDPLDLDLSSAAQQANVEAAQARFVQAKADEARHSQLLKSSAVSKQEYERAREALDSATAQVEAAKALAKVSDNSSQYAALTADADGVVVRTLGEPGQVVAAGQVVVQLAHEGPREASVNLPEGKRPLPGSKAAAQLYGQTKSYPAVLRQLSDAADPRSRTFEARYVLQGEAALASIGSTVTIIIEEKTDAAHRAFALPVGSVFNRGKGPGVWIVRNGTEVRFQPVELVSIGQEEALVKGDVARDDLVVALGAHLLHEGQNVRIANGGSDKQ